jgi:rhamnogalacturonyl hydrolase YesR
MPPEEPAAEILRAELEEFAGALLRHQGPDGMWHQVVDRPDSYPETSGTAAISYYFARAVVAGLLPRDPYAAASRRAWSALAAGFITAEGEVHGTCRGTPPLDRLQDYLDREQIVDDHHGTSLVIMAAAGQVMLDTGRSVPKVR